MFCVDIFGLIFVPYTVTMLEMGFDKASTDNLPKIDDLMTGAYFTDNPNFCSAEIRGVKNARSVMIHHIFIKYFTLNLLSVF